MEGLALVPLLVLIAGILVPEQAYFLLMHQTAILAASAVMAILAVIEHTIQRRTNSDAPAVK
jgi:hypothetical protein